MAKRTHCWPDEFTFCPLGVINDLSGVGWEVHGTDDWACDDDGETEVPRVALLRHLGLTKYAGIEELENGELWWFFDSHQEHTTITRWQVITYWNDMLQWTFEEIADEIEWLGWNV